MFYSELTGLPVYSTAEISIDRETAVCVTGHRIKSIIPYKGKSEYFGITCYATKLMLDRYIGIAMKKGYTTLLSGLAEGTDLWAAERLLYRKRFEKNRRLVGVMPYMKHYLGFKPESLELLRIAERYSDRLITTCDNVNMTYGSAHSSVTSPDLYRNRNYYLVDNSSVVIGFYCESNPYSGTAQTVRYAEKLCRPIFTFDINDVHSLLDRAGLEKMAIYNELKKLRLDIPEAPR